MSRRIAQAHDHLLKLLLEQPGIARAFLREQLPWPLASRLADEDPVLLPSDFILEELRELEPDLLLEARLRHGRRSCVCLVEHKSAPAPSVDLQILSYLAATWQSFRANAKRGDKLPIIVPLVVYHGHSVWRRPLRFSDSLAVDDEVRGLVLDFPIKVFDLRRVPELALSALPGLRGGLRLLRYGVRGPPAKMARRLLVSVLADLKGMPDLFLEAAGHYILDRWAPITRKDLRDALRIVMPAKEEVMLSKAAREFIAEGRKEGRKEGELRAEARILARQLERKFGPVPERLDAQIRRATIQQLELWLERVIDAERVEDVFSEPRC